MKLFQMMELPEAKLYVANGGQALHLHTFTGWGHKAFRGQEQAAHLMDQNKSRLIETARRLGVKRVKVERAGSIYMHVDLYGAPLAKAIAEAKQIVQSPDCTKNLR